MSSIPDNFKSVLKYLENYAKQTVRCDPDRYVGVNDGNTIKVNLPPNTFVDLRSLVMYYKGTTLPLGSTAAPLFQNRFFPRNSSSVIEYLAVNINGRRIETIASYNHLYNILWDYLCSLENNHTGKRALENTDPSNKSEITNIATGAITRHKTTATNAANICDTDRRFAITNFMGFLGSSSSEIIDTRIFGDIQLEIRLAPAAGLLWKSTNVAALTANLNPTPSYVLDDIYFTIDRITFQDDLFYEIQNTALMSEGIPLAWKTYVAHTDRLTNKSINMSFAVNTQSLDKLICTCIPEDYNTEDYLLLTKSNDGTGTLTQLEALSTNQPEVFNQSKYFQKDGLGILTSEVKINNNAVSQAPLTPEEILVNNCNALNITQDMNGGIFAGCYDINAWKKYWFTHIIPFNHRQNDSAFWIGGIDGKAAAINVKWTTSHDATNTTNVYPLVFSEHNKLLVVSAGQYIDVKM